MSLKPGTRLLLKALLIAGLCTLVWILTSGSWWIMILLLAVHVPGSLVFALSAFVLAVLCMFVYVFNSSATLTVGIALTVFVVGQACVGGVLAARGRLVENEIDWINRLLNRMDMGHVRSVILLLCMVTMVRALDRDVSLLEAGGWALMLWLTWRSLPRGRQRPRAYAVNYSMLGVSVVVSFLIVEIGMRFALEEVQRYGLILQSHPEYIFTLKPNARTRMKEKLSEDEYLRWEFVISPQGFRDRVYGEKRDGEYRILMIGDSFTMGHVPSEDSIPKQLEALFADRAGEGRVSVINAGISSAGPVQELGILQERGFAMMPDLVILQLFPANDINNCLEIVGKQLRAYARRPFRMNHQRKQQARNFFPVRCEAAARRYSRAYRELVLRKNNDEIIADWLRDFRFVDPSIPIIYPPNENRPPQLEANLVSWYPVVEEGFQILKDYVLRMKEECAARGIGFVGFCIPTKHNVSDKLWQQSVPQLQATYEQGKACRMVEEFYEEAGIPHFSISEALREGGPIEEVYFQWDSHLTALGNQIAAENAMDFILQNYLKL